MSTQASKHAESDAEGGPSNADVVRRLFGLSWRYRARSIQVFCLQMLLLGLTIGGLGLTGLAVDVIRHDLDPSAPTASWPLGMRSVAQWSIMAQLSAVAAGVVLMAAARSLLNFAYSVSVGRLIHVEMVPALRAELFNKLQRLSFRFFDANDSGSIINRVTRDVQMLRSFVDGVVIQSAVLLLSLGVFLAYMLGTHVLLTLVSLALTPLLFWATRAFSRWARPAYRESRVLADRMVRAMAEGIEGVVVTKVFGREDQQFDKFQAGNLAVREQQMTIFKNVSRFGPGVDLLSQLNLVVLLAYGGYLVAVREVTLGDLVVFAGLLQQFATRISGMSGIVNTLQQSMTGARRVFEVLDAPLEVQSAPDAIEPGRFRGDVRFDAVHFGYHEGMPALRGVTLHVEPGQCVGILGATGSGKSTLLSLIPRFYDPTSGQLYIDGTDISRFDLDAVRRQIGIVFQETLLFRDTVANNIAFGHPNATREQVERAARIAGAHGFICEMQDGYDAWLEEGATNLSGGQRQRLAIARALLLEPPILLMDDPTTAIDPQTEAEVLKAVDGAISGRTTFIVSGRLSTLRRADFVVVLAEGQVAEVGTHEELMKQDGLYRQAAELQGVDERSRELLRSSAEEVHP